MILGLEKIEEALKKADGEEIPKGRPQDRQALPSCTEERVNYVIKCVLFRKEGENQAILWRK